MDPNKYLLNTIKKSDNDDLQDILKVIRDNRRTRYYVEAAGFDKDFLTLCINEENCRVIFLNNDSFDLQSRLKFIKECPSVIPRRDIYFYYRQIHEDDLREYLTNKCTVLIWKEVVGSFKASSITALATTFPDQLYVIGSGFHPTIIKKTLLKAPLNMLFRKDDFTTDEILGFTKDGGNRVNIISEGFSDAELTDFKNAGALLLPEIVGA